MAKTKEKRHLIDFSDINSSNKVKKLMINRLVEGSLPDSFASEMHHASGYIVMREMPVKKFGRFKQEERYYAVLPENQPHNGKDEKPVTYRIYNLSIPSHLLLKISAVAHQDTKQLEVLNAAFIKQNDEFPAAHKEKLFNDFIKIDPLHEMTIELGSRTAAIAKGQFLILAERQARDNASPSR